MGETKCWASFLGQVPLRWRRAVDGDGRYLMSSPSPRPGLSSVLIFWKGGADHGNVIHRHCFSLANPMVEERHGNAVVHAGFVPVPPRGRHRAHT